MPNQNRPDEDVRKEDGLCRRVIGRADMMLKATDVAMGGV
jgi:hypothetical protein